MVLTSSLGAYAESDKKSLPEESKLSNPAISLKLEREEISYKLGESIEYTIRIKNTGDVVLNKLLLEDKLAGEEVIDTLDVGQELLFERAYMIPLENEEEFIENKATLSVDVGETRLQAEDSFEAYMERMSSTEFLPDDIEPDYIDEEQLEEDESGNDNMDAKEPIEEDSDEEEKEPEDDRKKTGYMGTMGLMSLATLAQNDLEDIIDVSKTAARILGCRTFEVTLAIIGTPPPNKPADVVLVIDTSTSMNSGNPTRMAATRTAATNFANIVLGDGNPNNNRISIVNYGTRAHHRLNWTNNLNTVISSISTLGPSGIQYTNIQEGFIFAEQRIDAARAEATKVIVMMSDGGANRWMDGSTLKSTTNYPTSHNASTDAAYGKGQQLQSKANIFTIGLFTGMGQDEKTVATETLKWAAPTGQFYDSPDTDDLDVIYGKIATLINYSAKDAVVVDKIGDNFEFVPGSFSPAGSNANYDSNTRTITWSPGTIGTSAELKYTVQAKPEFIGGQAFTNEYASLTYTDINGDTGQTKQFINPSVDVPAKLAISLTDATMTLGDSISLGMGTDPSGENYMSSVTGGDGTNYQYQWTIEGDTTGWTSSDKNPTVDPTEDTKYKLIVTDSNGCMAIATMWVRVTEPKVDVTIKKFIRGNFGDLSREFDFTVIVDEDEPIEFKLSHEESKIIEDLPAESVLNLSEVSGSYTVTVKVGEGEILPNQDGSYTITLTDEDITIMVTNNYDVLIDTGVPIDSLPYIIIIAMVLLGLGAMIGRRGRTGEQ